MHALGLDLVALDHLPAVLLDYVLYPFITLLMCLLSVFVVLGNLLVVTAIWHETQLHSVTNYLIASLAAADCLVGALVMPFSIISEMIVGSWTFGPTWCDLWHSFDVLASTASIMNLCAISLDRYLAITNPICYPTKMTPKRVALLIVSLWTCSSLISFPAILWWRAVGEGPLQQVNPPNNSISNREHQIFHHHQELPEYHQQVINSTRQPPPETQSLVPEEEENGDDGGQVGGEASTNSAQHEGQPFGAKKNVISELGKNTPPDPYHYLSSSSPSSQQDETNAKFVVQSNRNSEQQQHQTSPLDNGDPQAQELASDAAEAHFKCVFTDDTYYLLFSSFISFYGPLCVMLYAYICIYKAAVQQTRFLKYGSKQVMIGGGNGSSGSGGDGLGKNKRRRHASGHSQHNGGACDRMAEANCDGSCDNYERQHLVLRVHRGGGGGAVAAQSSKASTKESTAGIRPTGSIKHLRGTASPKSRQKVIHTSSNSNGQQTSPTDDDGDDEEEDESELDRRHEHLVSSSLDQTSTISDSCTAGGGGSVGSRVSTLVLSCSSMEANQSKRPIIRSSSANRSHRVNLTLSLRDKRRVESQRFTSSQVTKVEVDSSGRGNSLELNSSPATADAAASEAPSPGSMTTNTAVASWTKPQLRLAVVHGAGQKQCDSLDGSRAKVSSARSVSSQMPAAGQAPVDVKAGFRFAVAQRHGNSPMPPLPASLMPLIMMNSDTSTDSSTVTVVTRPVGGGRPAQTTVECGRGGEDAAEPAGGGEHGSDYAASLRAADDPAAIDGNSDSTSTRSSIGSTAEVRTTRKANQVTINLGFDGASGGRAGTADGGNAAGKAQILHYDSDKLIQSIDLTNIHYIDCTANQPSGNDAAISNGGCSGRPNSIAEAKARQTRSIIGKTLSHGSGSEQTRVTIEMHDNSSSNNNNNNNNNNDHRAQNHIDPESNAPLDGSLSLNAAAVGPASTKTKTTRTKPGSAPTSRVIAPSNVPQRQQRSVGRKLTKLAKERKAAKTLGIVVGVFILCWLPFFVVNILVALCGIKCIYKPEILFSVVTWLGWLNSAMNPVIYACWSRDFRRAFRRVLCTWVEFLCYDGSRLARKLKLKKGCSAYPSTHEIHSNRPASSTQRSGTSIENNTVGCSSGIGNTTSAMFTNSNNYSHRGLLSDQ